MAMLALKAIAYGAEKIPDELFERVPGGFFKSSDHKNNSKKDKHGRRSHSGSRRHRSPSASSDFSERDPSDYEDYENRAPRRRHRRRRDDSMARDYSDAEGGLDPKQGVHWVDQNPVQPRPIPAQQPYFPPPPREEVTSPYKPYNPADYASGGTSQEYYHNSPINSQPRQKTPYPSPSPSSPFQPMPISTAAARYHPANYAPNYAPSPQSPLQQPPYQYDSKQDDESNNEQEESRSRRHRSSKSKRSSSLPRNRSHIREKIHNSMKKIDHNERNLAVSVIGAVTGGIIGNEIGNGTVGTAIGAAIGGLGAGALEKRHHTKSKKKEDRERRDSGHDDISSSTRHRSPRSSGVESERARRRPHSHQDEVFESDDSD